MEEKSGVTDEKGHELDSNASSNPDKPTLLYFLKVDKRSAWCHLSGDKSSGLCMVACWDCWDCCASERNRESLIEASQGKLREISTNEL